MNFNYFILILMTSVFMYFTGCGSESYTIDESNGSQHKGLQDTSGTKNISEKKDSINRVPTMTLTQLNAMYPKKDYHVRTSAPYTFQINIGYNYGLSELNADYQFVNQTDQFEGGKNFGVRKGFGILAVVKKSLSNYDFFRVTFLGGFNYFNNNALISPTSSDGFVKYFVYSLGIGLENSFTPSFRVKPYFGVSLLFDIITGNAQYLNDTNYNVNLKIKPTFRIGGSLSTGIEYLLSKKIGLNFGVNLTCANLLLKSSQQSDDPYSINLRDRKPSITMPYAGYKQFLFTTFNFGLNYYFGIKERAFHL